MNIKLASERSGVSSRNIRYYEQAGLLHPDRDPENDYRIYTEEDIRTLKLIRTLRMLDMPLEEIRDVLAGSLPLPEAAARQHIVCLQEPLLQYKFSDPTPRPLVF